MHIFYQKRTRILSQYLEDFWEYTRVYTYTKSGLRRFQEERDVYVYQSVFVYQMYTYIRVHTYTRCIRIPDKYLE